MKICFKLFSLALLLLVSGAIADAKIVTKDVDYRDKDGTLFQGYLAYDDSSRARRPGVLLIHEWTGLGDYVKSRARKLAKLGYVAFAGDIYGKGVRPKPSEAGKEAGKYKKDRDLFRHRVQLAFAELKKQPRVNVKRTAAIGYCFGGTAVLELARSGANLKGVVSFHGGLETSKPAKAGGIRASVLVLHGADDPHVKPEEVSKFEKEMDHAHVEWELVKYSGAVHAFTNPAAGNDPSRGAAYNKRADQRSWAAMKQFFTEIFGS